MTRLRELLSAGAHTGYWIALIFVLMIVAPHVIVGKA